MAADINNRVVLRDAFADLATWQTWTGLGVQADRRARIVWPEITVDVFPVMLIGLDGLRWTENGNADSSSQMRNTGGFSVRVFDEFLAGETLQDDMDRFGGLVGDLIRDYVRTEETFSLLVGSITQDAEPYTLLQQNAHHSQDEDEDGVDDTTERMVWEGRFSVAWGWR